MYFQHQFRSKQRPRQTIIRLSHSSKILISTIVAILSYVVTHGQPGPVNHLQRLNYVDTTVEQIFETTIAVEKTRFIKRIVAPSEGVWQYIPYANQAKWVDLQIQLTTRIGFDIRNGDQVSAGITPEGKLRIDVFEPTVLDKQWQTKIMDSSDNFLFKWDIRQFKEKEGELLQALATEESMQILDSFRSDPEKMSELAYRLDQKLLLRKGTSYSPLQWLDNVNRMITSKLDEFSNSFTFVSNNSKPQTYDKQFYENARGQRESARPRSPSSTPSGQNRQSVKSRRVPAYKQISYSRQQEKIRRQMKNQLNL